MKTSASLVLLVVICATATAGDESQSGLNEANGSDMIFAGVPENDSYSKADGAPKLDLNNIKVGDIVDISPSEFDIKASKGYRKCLDDECEDFVDIPDTVPPSRKARIDQILHGHFIDPAVKHTVIYGVIADEDEPAYFQNHKFIRFQNGPIYDYFDVTDEAIATCQHPKTELANLVDITHSGGTVDGDFGYVNFIGVNPQTREMEVVYVEYAEHGPYNSKICGWPAKQEKLSMFSDAMNNLRIEDKDYYKTKVIEFGDDEYEIMYASIGELESGETMQLPWRSIPAKVVQEWLEKLDGLATDIVINGKPHPAMVEIYDEHIDDWRIIQITGTEICSDEGQGDEGQGVVLAKHMSQKDWRAIYNVEAGCSKLLNYPLLWREDESGRIMIENNMLPVTMYYEFTHWGEFRDVVIDLRTNVITAK